MDWLTRQPWPIYITPPNATNKRRPSRSKSDRGDAELMADLVRRQVDECRPLVTRGETVEHLRQLLRAYDGVLREQRRLGNRLIYQLKQYYPASLKAFSRPNNLISLAFLERYPTPDAAKAATVDDLHDFLREQRYGGKKLDVKLAELYQLLKQVFHEYPELYSIQFTKTQQYTNEEDLNKFSFQSPTQLIKILQHIAPQVTSVVKEELEKYIQSLYDMKPKTKKTEKETKKKKEKEKEKRKDRKKKRKQKNKKRYVVFFQAEDGIRDLVRSRGLGDVYKRQGLEDIKSELESRGNEVFYIGENRMADAVLYKEADTRPYLSLIHI